MTVTAAQPRTVEVPVTSASRSSIGWRQVAPAVGLVVLVTGSGLAMVLATSLGLVPLFGEPRLSADGFTAASGDLLASTRETLVIAVSATLLAAAIGMAVATALVGGGPGRRLLGVLAAGVVTVPHLVGAASVGLLLSDAGFAQRVSGLGSWPQLVGGPWPVATVLELAWKESAFVALVVVAAVSRRHRDLADVASVLGAGRFHRWTRVFLPLAAPALIGSSLIAFVYTVGSYEVPLLLGRSFPEPLPVMAYRLFGSIDLASRPQAAATAAVGAGLAMAIAVLGLPLLRRLGGAR